MRKWIVVCVATLSLLLIGSIATVVLLGRSIIMREGERRTKEITFAARGETYMTRLIENPDGSLLLEIIDLGMGSVAIRSSISANPVMRWFVEEDAEKVWFYTDAGLYVYTQADDETWSEVGWDRGEVAANNPIPDVVFERLSESMQEELQRYRVKPAK